MPERKEPLAEHKDYVLFAQSPVGKAILADLDEQFGGSAVDENQVLVNIKVGRQDVLAYINEMIEGGHD